MPFITEEIWQTLPHNGDSIMISDYPKYDERLNFAAEEDKMQKLIDLLEENDDVQNVFHNWDMPEEEEED